MEKKQTARDLMCLCCAVCGPLAKDEVERFFPQCADDDQFSKNTPLLRLASQPSLPSLKKIFDSTPLLRRLCEAIMALRVADSVSYKAPLPEHLRCIAAARYALMLGNSDEFWRLHRLFRGIPRFGVRQDAPRPEFWDGLLGESWQGVELIPAGQARDELYALMATRYLMWPPPEHVSIELERLPHILALGWGLLHADMRVKPRPSDKVDTEDTRDAEVLLGRAYWNIWAGSWENAYRCFHRLFRSREAQVYDAAEPYGGAVLLMATIVAIRTHAPERIVSLWCGIAQALIVRSLSESDISVRSEIDSFFDCLRIWDAVENRGARHFDFPPLQGALGSLPLAMGAQAIVRNTGVQLPVQRLVRDIIHVYRDGPRLLAFYAMSSLEQAPGIERAFLAPLKALDRERSFKPLYEIVKKKGGSVTAEQWGQIITAVENQTCDTRWLYWDIHLDRYGALESLEPRLVEKRPHAPGKKLSLDDVLDPAMLDCQTQRDLSVHSLASSLVGSCLRGVPLLAEALIDHPRLRVVEGGYHRPIRVEACRPVIKASVEKLVVKLKLDVRQFSRFRRVAGGARLALPLFTARMQMLVDYFSNGPVSLPLAHTEYLRWFLGRLQENFDIQGEPLPASLVEPPPYEPQLFVHASVYEGGYLFDMDVRHHPSNDAHDIPGQGERVLLLNRDEEPVCIVRDFEAEERAAQRMVDSCPVLRALEARDFQWFVPNAGDALQAMYDLRAAGVDVQWQAGKPALYMVEPAASTLRLTVPTRREKWLEIGASLKVDEDMVLNLTQLLEIYERRAGSFLPLDEKRYLRMTPVLAEQLQRLAESLRRERKRYVLPLAAVPGFVAQWQGGSLPKALLEQQALLERCNTAQPPAGLATPLRDYQLAGFRWLLARAKVSMGACLADDMGLGKTLQALALLLELSAAGPSLVAAPASLLSNWAAEAARFAPSLRVTEYAELRRRSLSTLGPGDVLLVSYGQMVSNEEPICSIAWNVALLDEAQYIKNPASRRAIVAYRLQASVRLCLTGTPVENELLDLWSIMHFLNPGLLEPKSDYARPGRVDVERLRRIVAPLILRRRKEDVLPELPPITEMKLEVELSDDERALYESCRRRAVALLDEEPDSSALLAAIMRLRRLCCHGKLALDTFAGESTKLRHMLQMVQELLRADHSVLVFSQFTDVLDLAEGLLSKQGIPTLRFDGSMPLAMRAENVQSFQAGSARVFLISLRAGGVGLNLTAADYVILLDPWWNPAVEAQAASRSHRMGQSRPVTICRIIAKDTIEERITHMSQSKQLLAESVVHTGDVPLEALRELLS